MYNENNDYELLYLIGENNEDAYNELFTKYNRLIKMVAKKAYINSKYLGVSFDDIYDEGLCGFYSAITSYNDKEGTLFYTYVMATITKRISTFVRNYNRNKHNVLSDSISLDKPVDEKNNTIDNFIVSNDGEINLLYNYERLKKIVDFKYDLSFLHSLVYELRLNNFSNKEIAILLEISYKKIDNILRDIKDKLGKRINLIEEF